MKHLIAENINLNKFDNIIVNTSKETWPWLHKRRHEMEEFKDNKNQEILDKEEPEVQRSPEIYSIKNNTQN